MVATGHNVGIAFALNIAAGLATCIGGSVVFSKSLVHLASPKSLSVALSLSAGVMLFISLVEIYGKSVEGFTAGLGEDNADGEYECDQTCQGNSWLAVVGEGLNPVVEGVMFGIVTGMMVTISIKELIPTAVKYWPQGSVVTVAIFGGMLIMATSLILFAYAGV
ncbi:hypothetical protein H257_02891 [Aphanomyces astaci]|uniref:Uncharacterized protein n=1 Tax=Aphanomyces astaci TaxID=112090 RepID=W4H1G6_APHAT|nr:hypothetical protein H257_02891 [Aphanomyces astaci]ETV84998.1 hypothetical protein H257_02891 [Aphanomyces astaci]|eukprot:XP_009825016.1 hypothetical protein H257_02891 [Aphanomyces astaci]